MRRSGIVSGGAIALALMLAGCGGSEATSDAGSSSPLAEESSSSAEVHVVAEDISFPESRYDADAGEIDITYDNEGSITHTLVIENVDGFKLTVEANGDEAEGTVDLPPGEYTLYCDVAGHREAGMEATLTVS